MSLKLEIVLFDDGYIPDDQDLSDAVHDVAGKISEGYTEGEVVIDGHRGYWKVEA